MADAAGGTPQRTVLVVDDDPDLRALLKFALEDAGYQVVVAPDGLTALRTVAEQVPDVILLDMLMPDMDGQEVVTRLRSRPETAGLPVIAVTGYADTLLDLPGGDDPNLYYCPKPFDLDRVIAAIEQAIAKREGRLPEQAEVAGEYAD